MSTSPQESAATQEARELSDILEILRPKVHPAIVHADDEQSMRLTRLAKQLGEVAVAAEASLVVSRDA